MKPALDTLMKSQFSDKIVPTTITGGRLEIDSAAQRNISSLTSREREVLTLIADGYSTKEVAAILGVSFKTAACHRYHIMSKLSAPNAPMLVRLAIRHGLIQP